MKNIRKNDWKWKLPVFTVLALFITLSFSSYFTSAQNADGQEYLPPEEFYENPTTENFQMMHPDDQREYLFSHTKNIQDPNIKPLAYQYVDGADYDVATGGQAAVENNAIADAYFASADDLNGHKKTFERKFKEGNKVSVKISGDVQTYAGGSLKTADQEINLYQLDTSDSIYGVVVDATNSLKIEDIVGKEHSFEGAVEPAGTSELFLQSGSIDGYLVEDATFWVEGSHIDGKAEKVQGIKFGEKTYFYVDEIQDLIGLPQHTPVVSIDKRITLNLEGENIILPEGDILHFGKIAYANGKPSAVGEQSSATVQEFRHTTTSAKLTLLFPETPELAALDAEEEAQSASLKSILDPSLLQQRDALAEQDITLKKEAKKLEKELAAALREGDKEKIKALEEKLTETNVEINVVEEKLNEISDKIYPVLIKLEESERLFREKRSALYQKISLPNEGAFFAYGKDRIWLGGSGFTSEVTENNAIFPLAASPYGDGIVTFRRDRIVFSPQGGTASIVKASEGDRPLALNAYLEGKMDIRNGKWHFSSDGEHILADTEEADGEGIEFLEGTDTRFVYTAQSGKLKKYDLDIDTMYHRPFSAQELAKFEGEKSTLDAQIYKSKIQLLEFITPEVLEIEGKLGALIKKENEAYELQTFLYGQLRRAEQYGTLQQATAIRTELEKNKLKLEELENERILMAMGSDAYKKYRAALSEISSMEIRRDAILENIETASGEPKTGAFGQIITSDDGNVKLRYEEFVEGFPIIKNTDIYKYTREVYSRQAGVTIGGEVLRVPEIFEANEDKLNIDVTKPQECIDTQIRLRFEYARATGQNVKFSLNDGTVLDYGLWKQGSYKDKQFANGKQVQYSTSDHSYMATVMNSLSTSTYIAAIEAIEKGEKTPFTGQIEVVADFNKIKPGDVILQHGHALAVREVLELPPGSGNVFIRRFAGSQPAIDAHVYHDLQNVKSLEFAKKKGMIVTVFRWKN